ncbi:MAG: FkbM family methyltransferase, partial [Candidatus Hermodarchaeota archaeon]
LLNYGYSERIRLKFFHLINKKSLLRNFIRTKKFKKFSEVFHLLDDRYSKKLFIKLIFKYIIAREHFAWKYYYDDWTKTSFEEIKHLIKKRRYFLSGNKYFDLYNLKEIGFPIELILDVTSVRTIFLFQQYKYHRNNNVVETGEGDVVLDAGAGWGDTALYFANRVFPSGKVYTFEFIPHNVNILSKNINLNPKFKDIIKVIKVPLWSTSNKELEYIDIGTSSKIIQSASKKSDFLVKTISIDDFVKQNNISKIDFIKMDIEGAELDALIGAKETIIKYKPILAICIYHLIDHYYQIPKYIHSLNPNYKLYIDHFSTGFIETVLFAKIN